MIVTDVQCPVLSLPEPPLIGKIEGARMGHGAVFECPIGYRLEGAAGITCQYNGKTCFSFPSSLSCSRVRKRRRIIVVTLGKWSADMPRCETIECPAMDTLGTDTRLQLIEYNNSFGGKAAFACMWGHRLLGSRSIECKGDGTWSGARPSCAGKSILPYRSQRLSTPTYGT